MNSALPKYVSDVTFPYTRTLSPPLTSGSMNLSEAVFCVYPTANSSTSSRYTSVTFSPEGLFITIPASNAKFASVLFLPISMIGSWTSRFTLFTLVTVPAVVRSPSMNAPPRTTNTFDPVSMTLTFAPTSNVFTGCRFETPTDPDPVTNDVVGFVNTTVVDVVAPCSATFAKS